MVRKQMKRLKEKLIHMTIWKKVWIGMLIAAWIPLLGFGIYVYQKTEKILVEQNYERMEENVDQAAENLRLLFQNYEEVSSMISMSDFIPMLMNTEFDIQTYIEVYFDFKEYLAKLMSANGEIDQIAIFSGNQSIYQDFKYIYKLTPEIRETNWYRKAVGSNGKVQILCGGEKEGLELYRSRKREPEKKRKTKKHICFILRGQRIFITRKKKKRFFVWLYMKNVCMQ